MNKVVGFHNSFSSLWGNDQKELIEDQARSIEKYGLKETLDCLISAIELRQEKLSDESKEYKNLQLILETLESVSKAEESLEAMEVHAIHETEAFRIMREQQKRRRIMADMLLNIAQIKVM